MTTITVTQFKAYCPGIFDKLHESSEEVVVTKHGKPVAKVIPTADGPHDASWQSLRGTAHFSDQDILATDDAWEAAK